MEDAEYESNKEYVCLIEPKESKKVQIKYLLMNWFKNKLFDTDEYEIIAIKFIAKPGFVIEYLVNPDDDG